MRWILRHRSLRTAPAEGNYHKGALPPHFPLPYCGVPHLRTPDPTSAACGGGCVWASPDKLSWKDKLHRWHWGHDVAMAMCEGSDWRKKYVR